MSRSSGQRLTDADLESIKTMFEQRGTNVKVRHLLMVPEMAEVELFTPTTGERWRVTRLY